MDQSRYYLHQPQLHAVSAQGPLQMRFRQTASLQMPQSVTRYVAPASSRWSVSPGSPPCVKFMWKWRMHSYNSTTKFKCSSTTITPLGPITAVDSGSSITYGPF